MRTPAPAPQESVRGRLLDNVVIPIIIYMALIGTMAALGGGAAPESLDRATPTWLTWAWGLSLGAGGLLASYGCARGQSRGEAVGLTGLIFGLWLFFLAETVTNWPIGLEESLSVAALLGCCLLRLRQLHKGRQADRLVASILEEA